MHSRFQLIPWKNIFKKKFVKYWIGKKFFFCVRHAPLSIFFLFPGILEFILFFWKMILNVYHQHIYSFIHSRMYSFRNLIWIRRREVTIPIPIPIFAVKKNIKIPKPFPERIIKYREKNNRQTTV